MKAIKLLFILVAAVGLASCSTTKRTATTIAIETSVVQYPTVADLEIGERKVMKKVTWSSLFSMTSYGTRKGNTIAELVAESGADVLVEPQFIHKSNMLGHHELTVIGFPAKYKNFRKATEADLKAIQAGCRDLAPVSSREHKHKTDKAKRSFGALLGGVIPR